MRLVATNSDQRFLYPVEWHVQSSTAVPNCPRVSLRRRQGQFGRLGAGSVLRHFSFHGLAADAGAHRFALCGAFFLVQGAVAIAVEVRL